MWFKDGGWSSRCKLANMVKVYKCHNFRSQNVIQVDNEPVSLFAYQDRLFVATQNCCIFVYRVLTQKNCQRTNAFATEARVQQLQFNETGECYHPLSSYRTELGLLNWTLFRKCSTYFPPEPNVLIRIDIFYISKSSPQHSAKFRYHMWHMIMFVFMSWTQKQK